MADKKISELPVATSAGVTDIITLDDTTGTTTTRRITLGQLLQSGVSVSGVTITTSPSGVTIDKGGIQIPAGFTVGYGTQGYKFVAGQTAWAGVSISITHGLTTLTSLSLTYEGASGTSVPSCVYEDKGVAGGVSAAMYVEGDGGGSALKASGGTINYLAFGV